MNYITTQLPLESPILFDVEEQPIYYEDSGVRRPFEGQKILLRKESYRRIPVAIVGQNYKVVTNRELLDAVEDQLTKALSKDVCQNVRIKDHMSYGGKVCFREYIFRDLAVRGVGQGDILFRVIVKNGFGGSAIHMYYGAIDMFCTNGMITGDFEASYRKHTKALNLADFTRRISNAAENFQIRMEHAIQTMISHELLRKHIWEILESNFPTKLAAKIEKRYYQEVNVRGHNAWALYSALTYYASGRAPFEVRQTDNDHKASTLLKREMVVRKALSQIQASRYH